MLFLMRTVKFSAAVNKAGLHHGIKHTQIHFNIRTADKKLQWLKSKTPIESINIMVFKNIKNCFSMWITNEKQQEKPDFVERN